MANRTLAVLRRMCAWAVARGSIAVSPCGGIPAPSAEKPRDRVLSDDELRAVWLGADSLGQPYTAFVKVLALTGQRRGEVAGMTWREIDLDNCLWTIPKERVKNGSEHVVPLAPQAIAILRLVPERANSGLVFTLTGRHAIASTSVRPRLDRLMPDGGAPWVLHDLRRTFASGCARLGVAIHVVERLLNHRSGTFGGIVSVYQKHDFANEQRAAVEVWARHVEALVRGGEAGNVVELKARADARV
jgi:integrase